MKRYLLVLLSICFAFVGCKSKKIENNSIVSDFVLSDTMIKNCEFSEVKLLPSKENLSLFGKIQADNNKLAHVEPIVGGNVLKINVELGDYIKQGQVLAVVQSGEVAEFEKEYLDASSDVALAEKNLSVAKDLFEGKLNSEKDVITAQKELVKARAELNRIKEIYDIYNLKGGSIYNITAPISGFIVQKEITQNEKIKADGNTQLFSIAEIDEVWVMANVNELDISKVTLGLEADIKTISFPDITYHGHVDKIFNAIDPETKAMKIRVKIANKDLKLKPEMNAKIDLHLSTNTQKLAVPASAVIFDDNKNWVLIVTDKNVVKPKQVEVDHQYNNIMYISDGLKEGEKIISKNGLLIYDAITD